MDTIFALATARGKAGVAVVRVSGPAAVSGVELLCSSVPKSRGLRKLRSKSGELLDEAFVLVFEDGHSFTGETVVELHLHGSGSVVTAVMGELAGISGFRMAEAGEFTRRAFENGRLDLAQVEGLADLIEAETEAQRLQALRIFSGALRKKAEVWRTDLLRAVALLEATIDFVDEDVPVDVSGEVMSLLEKTRGFLLQEISGIGASELIRDGFEVAIVGEPNAGKSTLLNALAGRDAAIISELAGTTRDVIEVRMDLGGLAVTLLDTAGLRETEDQIEEIGVRRAIERAKNADLRVFLLSDGKPVTYLDPGDQDIQVEGKADLGKSGFSVSGKTGEGVAELIMAIESRLEERVIGASTANRERHRVALQTSADYLGRAISALRGDFSESEVVAEELWTAIRSLDSLFGRVDVEDVLGEVFSNFCIGK